MKLLRVLRVSFVFLALGLATSSEAILLVQPDCPALTDEIVVYGSGPTVALVPLSVTVSGPAIKLVALAYDSGFTLPAFTQVRAPIGKLPVGSYRLDFYARRQLNASSDPLDLGPEQFLETKFFEVRAIPPTCAATEVEVVGASVAGAAIRTPYPDGLRARVTDAHGNPVPQQEVPLTRIRQPTEPSNNDPVPDVFLSTPFVTDSDGVASLTGTANNTPGAFEYEATIYKPGTPSVAYFTFYNAPPETLSPTYPVVEFVRTTAKGLQHFFMTGDQAEMAKLDRSPDWKRTGAVFMAFPPGSGKSGTTAVCRFYGLPSAGLDSHFFSASAVECAEVQQRFADSWVLETSDAFEVFLPDTQTGACPSQTRPVYRAFNNLADANHRYALSQTVALSNAFPVDGPRWTLEGYGLDAVVMCSPQ